MKFSVGALALPTVILLACGGENSSSSSSAKSSAAPAASSAAAKPQAAPNPQSKLVATLDGKPVSMVTALAFPESGGRTTIEVSSVPLSCADYSGNGRMLAKDEVNFSFSVGEFLHDDGKFGPALRSSYFSGMNQMLTTPVKSSGSTAEGGTFSVELDFSTQSVGDNKQTLAVKGTVEAKACPAKKVTGEPPKLPAAMPATLEIGGKSLPIRSAGIEKDGDRIKLILSTGGDACPKASNVVRGELTSTVIFEANEEAKLRELRIWGEIAPQALDQTVDAKKVVVTPKLAGAGSYELAIDEEVVKFNVKAKGKVEAVLCE